MGVIIQLISRKSPQQRGRSEFGYMDVGEVREYVFMDGQHSGNAG